MRRFRKILSMLSYGVESLLINEVEPTVVNYTHFTCVMLVLLWVWKCVPTDKACLLTIVFALHLVLFFVTGYLKGTTYGAQERAHVRRYQVIETCLIILGTMLQPEIMLGYVIFSYGLPYVMEQLFEFLMIVPVSKLGEYFVFWLMYVVVWAPAIIVELAFSFAGFDLLWTAIGLVVYFVAVPFVISFEDDYANLYEIAFNMFV